MVGVVVVRLVGTCCLHNQQFDITFHCGCCMCKVHDDGQWNVASGTGNGNGDQTTQSQPQQQPQQQQPSDPAIDDSSSREESNPPLNSPNPINSPNNHNNNTNNKGQTKDREGNIQEGNNEEGGKYAGASRDFGTDFFLTGDTPSSDPFIYTYSPSYLPNSLALSLYSYTYS